MDEERNHPGDPPPVSGTRSTSERISNAVDAGMDAYLLSTARGASEEEAFAAALGRSMERYLDSLDPEARLRLLVGLHPPNRPIPEERVLPEDPGELAATREAAKRLAEAGEVRRVRDTATGRVYWLRPEVHPRAPEPH